VLRAWCRGATRIPIGQRLGNSRFRARWLRSPPRGRLEAPGRGSPSGELDRPPGSVQGAGHLVETVVEQVTVGVEGHRGRAVSRRTLPTPETQALATPGPPTTTGRIRRRHPRHPRQPLRPPQTPLPHNKRDVDKLLNAVESTFRQ
jgi:hypothetical protein